VTTESVQDQAELVLVDHQRHRAGCLCGWSGLGKSLPLHQAQMLAAAGLLVLVDSDEALAVVLDPQAFEVHAVEERSQAAALQWAARRHLAREHADRAMAAGWHR